MNSVLQAQQLPVPVPTTNADVAGATATQCQKDAGRWFETAFGAASDSVGRKLIKSIDYPAIGRQQHDQLRSCVQKLDASKFDGAELLELARTYARIDEHEAAARATTHYLSARALPDSTRASALLSMVRQYSLRSATDIGRAEPYMQQLDAMARTATVQRLRAHEDLFNRYQSFEIDPGSQKHALAIIKLARSMKAEVRTAAHPGIAADAIDRSELMTMYQTAATVDGNFGREANAIELLEQAPRDHPEIAAAVFDSAFAPTLARLKLIGQSAAAIESAHWFNAPANTRTMNFAGHVTVLGFTAHWCPPCRGTYVPLQAMSDSMSNRGVRFVFVTTYFGYVGRKRNLTAEQELEENRRYYDERKITFPVAMVGDGFDPGTFTQKMMSDAFGEYHVQQIPQAVIIDRHGKIRRIVVGWDQANSERLPALLNALLREK